MTDTKVTKDSEGLFFFKKLIKNPKSVGAIVPSSKNLGEYISRYVPNESGHFVVELGAGTGSLTKALLKSGIQVDHLILIEVDREMCQLLHKKFPGVIIIHGDARSLRSLLPPEWLGCVGTIISGIPMINLNQIEQNQIINSCFDILSPNGQLLQFTYGPISPLPAKKMGLRQKRLGHVLLNVPPASLWSYKRLVPQEVPPELKTTFEKFKTFKFLRNFQAKIKI